MKLNTDKYKLSIFTEDTCEDCTKIKEILKEKNIPFVSVSITRNGNKQNEANRWNYIDAEREHNLPWYTPVLIVEDTSGNTTYIPSVQDKNLFDEGTCIESSSEVMDILKPYLI